jgi:hypothetical protein
MRGSGRALGAARSRARSCRSPTAPHALGRVEFYSDTLQQVAALPTTFRSERQRGRRARYPLRCHVPPNRFFPNSSFSQSTLCGCARGPPCRSPDDAASGGSSGALVALANDRPGLFTAVLSDDAAGRIGVEGICWHKFMPGVGGERPRRWPADMGGGPAFHSTMVGPAPTLSDLLRHSSGRGEPRSGSQEGPRWSPNSWKMTASVDSFYDKSP